MAATSLAVVACGGSGSNALGQGGACKGAAPSCYGSDLNRCCSQEPAGSATCESGAWMCGAAGAPGCNGAACGPSDGGTQCIGTPPNCYGNDAQGCCGQDPLGSAACEGGQWRCGTAVAPGCSTALCTPLPNAGPFTCGNTMTCTGSQYCLDQPGGIYIPDAGPIADSYVCAPIPSSCASTPTCACIEAAPDSCQGLPVASCSQGPAGSVTLSCIGE